MAEMPHLLISSKLSLIAIHSQVQSVIEGVKQCGVELRALRELSLPAEDMLATTTQVSSSIYQHLLLTPDFIEWFDDCRNL